MNRFTASFPRLTHKPLNLESYLSDNMFEKHHVNIYIQMLSDSEIRFNVRYFNSGW